MTYRLTIAIDPGLTGAIALLADGEPREILDMPTRRIDGVHEICAATLADQLRCARAAHVGAYVSAVLEKVNGRAGWGATQGFRFGIGFGKVKAVLETLRIPTIEVQAPVWKRHYRLKGGDKDASREIASLRFPTMADYLTRKKDDGRAEALLIGLWHDSTQNGARAA